MSLKMIIATGLNGEIGCNNQLLWKCKEDMEYFKDKTAGHIVVMGNNTFKSLNIPMGLPNRHNIVLTTKNPHLMNRSDTGVIYTNDLSGYTSQASIRTIESLMGGKDAWVIGGASIYKQLKEYVTEIHWTIINGEFPHADTYFDMSWVKKGEYIEVEKVVLSELATVSVFKKRNA